MKNNMTREETRQMMSIMEAYAEGNEIEVLNTKTKEWEYVKNPKFSKAPNMYRVRQKPNYRPFNSIEELWEEMQKHQPFGWIKDINGNTYTQIVNLSNSKLVYYTLGKFMFIDGTPFGIRI